MELKLFYERYIINAQEFEVKIKGDGFVMVQSVAYVEVVLLIVEMDSQVVAVVPVEINFLSETFNLID